MEKAQTPIKIAVSSCLIGLNVRYDGLHKKHSIVTNFCDIFECVAICPEANIGLGVPRAPLKIVWMNNSFRVRGRTNPNYDVTHSLQKLATRAIRSQSGIRDRGIRGICGYVFKARSPSCGVNSTPWFDESGKEMGLTSGAFSEQIKKAMPNLPTIEETQLEDPRSLDCFIVQVKNYSGQ